MMSEEILVIDLISGIVCKDGRRFQELICTDKNGNDVRIVVPTARDCGKTCDCDDCDDSFDCGLEESYYIDIGRKVIIKR